MKKQKGFTLIELLVVIAIIGILASVILASLNTARTKAQDAQRASDVKTLETALEIYYDDNGGYPTSSNSSNGDVLLSDSILISKLVPQYIPSMPAVLISDGDHYYANDYTTGVAPKYDLFIQTSKGPCRAGVSPENVGSWGLPTICPF